MADRLSSAAPERIRDELMKILLCPKPSRGFNIMRRSGLLKQVMPELLEGYLMRQNSYHKYTVYRHIMETVDRVVPDPFLRLAALLHDIAKPRVRRKEQDGFNFYDHEKMSAIMGEKIMKRLRFSKDIVKKVSHIVSLHEIFYDRKWSDGAVRRLIRKAGKENISDLLSLRKADLLAHGVKDEKLDLITELEQRAEKLTQGVILNSMKGLAIGGERVMELLSIEQGPYVGEVLKNLMEKVTDKPELNTFDQLSSLVKKMRYGG
jgi:putative nucleotidyltransferase with HDIG domain